MQFLPEEERTGGRKEGRKEDRKEGRKIGRKIARINLHKVPTKSGRTMVTSIWKHGYIRVLFIITYGRVFSPPS